jgi:hypothetical protein
VSQILTGFPSQIATMQHRRSISEKLKKDYGRGHPWLKLQIFSKYDLRAIEARGPFHFRAHGNLLVFSSFFYLY